MYFGWITQEFYDNALAIIADKGAHYIKFKIPKSNGKTRTIEAPDDELKALQTVILGKVLLRYPPHPIAHGFVKNRSPKTNAECHIGAKIVINMDLKDFFPSIKIDRVKRVLDYLMPKLEHHYYYMVHKELTRDEIIDLIAELVTYKGKLPQGAPTSPAFSNLAVLGMDKELKALEADYGCCISRYADDITISSDYNTLLPSIIKPVKALIRKYGFRTNNAKTRIRRKGGRMMVTGVVVNVKPNIQKTTRRNLRAKLHNLITDETTITELEYSQLRGQAEWINYLNPLHGQKLINQLGMVKK